MHHQEAWRCHSPQSTSQRWTRYLYIQGSPLESTFLDYMSASSAQPLCSPSLQMTVYGNARSLFSTRLFEEPDFLMFFHFLGYCIRLHSQNWLTPHTHIFQPTGSWGEEAENKQIHFFKMYSGSGHTGQNLVTRPYLGSRKYVGSCAQLKRRGDQSPSPERTTGLMGDDF